MSWYGYKLTNARHNVDMPFLKILSILIFSLSRFNGRPTHFWPGTNVKINEQSLILKQPSAGDLVEASSNLFASVKTTARELFVASPLRKKSWDFFRLRSNSEVYSSSISDCTAYNEAYCDAGSGTSRKLLPTFSMRLQIFDLVSRISALRTSKVGRGYRVAPHPIKVSLFRPKKLPSDAAAIRCKDNYFWP